jgi:hypothetical protein
MRIFPSSLTKTRRTFSPRRSSLLFGEASVKFVRILLFGLTFASQFDFAALPLATLASYHARDYRDALTRQARFYQLCAPAEMRIQERRDECVILKKWLYAIEEEPSLLVDACLAILVELGA